jgi:hypothetical protein
MQGLDADELKTEQAAQEPTVNGGRTLSRSTSLGPASQGVLNAPQQLNPHNSTTRPILNPPRPPNGSQTFRQGKPFARVHSDGENARRAAIQGVFSASQIGSQGVRPPAASQFGVGMRNTPQPSVGNAVVQRPSVIAGVTQDEIEALRQQVAQVCLMHLCRDRVLIMLGTDAKREEGSRGTREKGGARVVEVSR